MNQKISIPPSTEELLWSNIASEFVKVEAEELDKLDEELKGLPEYELSSRQLERFERKVRCTQKRYPSRKLKYGLIAVVAALLLCITLSVTAFRDSSIQFLMRLDGKTGIINNLDNGLYLSSEMLVPAYIPNGFVVTNFILLEQGGTLSFENINKKYFTLTQRKNNSAIEIDTENAEVYQDKKVKKEAAILTVKQNGQAALYWNTPRYSYELVADISFEEMLKIAESIPQT